MTVLTQPASQAPIRLEVSSRTALVTVDTARAVRGTDAETIITEIDAGSILWVFNIATDIHATRRALRIYAPALAGPAAAHLTADSVISHIIGTTREYLRGSEVERLLLCSGQLVKELHETGQLTGTITGNTRQILRTSIDHFLRTRRVM